MEVDPEAKRVRRDHEHTAYPNSAPPLRPATVPVPTHAAAQHQYSDSPPSVLPANSYQPPGSRPPLARHSAPSGAPIYRRDSGPDPRSNPQYQPPTSQPGVHNQRPGYGSLNQSHPRPYPPEQSPPRHSTAPSGPVPHPPTPQEGKQPPQPMDQYVHAGHPPVDPHTNGPVPNGLPYHQGPDPYAVGPLPQGYAPPAPPATGGYAQASAYHSGGPTNYGSVTRRKQVRATQACNNCRQRKQKCDELRPCSYCKNEGLDCEYREVPPPKTDRSITQILDQAKGTADRVEQLEGLVKQILSAVTQQGYGPAQPHQGNHAYQQDEFQAPHGGRSMNLSNQGSSEPARPIKQESDPAQVFPDQGPQEHETGAHHLMEWPLINKFFTRAGISTREYVQEEEEKAGTLRPYGWSEVPDSNPNNPNTAASPSWSSHSDSMTANSPTDGLNGADFGPSPDNNKENIGGLNPDGTLKLDKETVERLYESYMKHMWSMHPFLDVQWLLRKINKFVSDQAPQAPMTRSPNFAVPGVPASRGGAEVYGGLPVKRKRPSGASDHISDPGTPEAGPYERTGQPGKPERSMTNAIVLLVLALGKVLESNKFLLQPDEISSTGPPPQHSGYKGSPGARPSPSQFNQYFNRTNVPSPNFESRSRASSTDYPMHNQHRATKLVRNVDIYPGLAYFAYASDILGNNFGGNDIIHAQAFLLAGLYFGQLGRVLESWSWINCGCRATMMLRAKKRAELNNPIINETGRVPEVGPDTDDDVLLISILCWSALQLESDLRAELDRLPKPGDLMYSESKTRMPRRVVGVPGGDTIVLPHLRTTVNTVNVMFSYFTQIYMRLTLNRVHISLYAPVSDEKHPPKRNLAWADVDAAMHWQSLDQHRNLINNQEQYRWEDGDEPSSDLLTARMRAKYYGAAYIILRPYLFSALGWREEEKEGQIPVVDWLMKQANIPPEQNQMLELPDRNVTLAQVRQDERLAHMFLWCCKKCIDCAMFSTVAFDGVANPCEGLRPRVTNIHGTATAQFSNMLVLVSAYKSWLQPLVPYRRLCQLMDRTLLLHDKLKPLSPVFDRNWRVLCEAQKVLLEAAPPSEAKPQIPGSNWFHGSPASIHSQGSIASPAITPRHYSTPTTMSAHSSFGPH